MKKLTSLFVLLLISVGINLYSQENIPKINRINYLNDIDAYADGVFKYDAYFITIRKFENRKQSGGEDYAELTADNYAAAFFLKDKKLLQAVEKVRANGVELEPVYNGNLVHYFRHIGPLNVNQPNVLFNVTGMNDFPGYISDTINNSFRFPDLYYIKECTESVNISENADWTASVSRWNGNAGLSLPRPDYLNIWVCGPSSDETISHRQFSVLKHVKDVSSSAVYSTIIPAEFSAETYRGVRMIAGRGAAVVRTYKMYPVDYTDPSTGKKWNFVFIMISETEKPVQYN